MSRILWANAALVGLTACGGHYHGHHAPPPTPIEYRHYHRLRCDHLVECRYYGGRHRYTSHRSHDRYWHVHRTERGRYVRCYVERRRHEHRRR